MTQLASQIGTQPAIAGRRAPLQIELKFQLDVAPAEAFDLMSTRLAEWFAQIHDVTWDHARSNRGASTLGVCSERVCNFGGKSLLEEIVEFEPGRRYAYRIDMAKSQMKMPIRNHLGTFAIEATSTGTASVVMWHQYFDAKWLVPAAMLRWQMRDKLMRPAVDEAIRKYGGVWIKNK